MAFESLITFLKIENKNLNLHSDPWIKSDRDSIRNSCDVFLLFSKASWFWAFPLLSTRFCFSHKYVIVCVWTIAIHATHDKIYVEIWPASVSQKCPCMTCVTYMSICGQSQRTWRHWCFPLPERPACSFHTLVAILVARVTAKYEEQWLSRTKSIQI